MKITISAMVAAMALSAVSPAVAAPIDPLALYRFEQGNASDTSGNGNDGTVVGGVTFLGAGSGYDGLGRAADVAITSGLSGIDTGLDIQASLFPELTFGAWVFADTSGSTPGGKVLSHDNGSFDRTLGIDSRGSVPGSDYSAFTGSGVVDTGEGISGWTHIAASYDGSTVSLYQNGLLAATAADATDLDITIFNLFIGTNPGFDEDFDGRIDEVFVYGRSLNGGEILDIFENGFDDRPVPLPGAIVLFVPFAAAALRKVRK
ncbi:MAG: LamG domain-containing protein [Pseudomonadota bacterium]